MLRVARRSAPQVARNIGYANVEFRKGRIQDTGHDLEALERRLSGRPVFSKAAPAPEVCQLAQRAFQRTWSARSVVSGLAAALNCVEDGYREVFVPQDIQKISAADAGRIPGMSEGAVHTRLHRTRLQMREHLTPLIRAPRPLSMAIPLRMMVLMSKTMMKRTISWRRDIHGC
jgi:hypothetical protein